MNTALTSLDETKLYSLILSDDITYEGVIKDIIKQQGMDPWDLNLDKLTSEYLEFIKKIKKLDFRVCGKFILTAAILLKLKSDNLKLKPEKEEIVDTGLEFDSELIKKLRAQFGLINVEDVFSPKVPLQKKRVATIDDLMSDLKEALEVKERRDVRWKERFSRKPDINIKKIDIFSKMRDIYERVKTFFLKKEKVAFSEVMISEDKKDVIWTIVPLLELATSGQIGLEQEKEFDEIYIVKGVKYGEKLTRKEDDD